MPKVTLLNYGIGNIFSVTRALENVCDDITVTSDAAVALAADRLVVPGVGAFGDVMHHLQEKGFDQVVKEYATKERPFLGICVGLQMLFDESEEYGPISGLGLLPGKVVAIPEIDADGRRRKTPHIGWTALHKVEGGADWSTSILKDTDEQTAFYFVHTYSAVPKEVSNRLADADHEGVAVSAAVQRGTLFGTQFHPEKSGNEGLKVLKAFCSL